ncbi:MAG: hypothetical protein GY703_07890 [Gammaproteobacteria bacterium]|nr:hypothetical protein [Gammaproteobacteria bacterium]
MGEQLIDVLQGYAEKVPFPPAGDAEDLAKQLMDRAGKPSTGIWVAERRRKYLPVDL